MESNIEESRPVMAKAWIKSGCVRGVCGVCVCGDVGGSGAGV